MSQDNQMPPLPPEAQRPPQTPPLPPPTVTPGLEYASGPVALTQDEKTMGMLCHLLGIFCGFFGPLILWLVKKDESAFINDQGKEALNFQITVMIASVVAMLLIFVLIGIVLLPAVGIANVVFCILGAVEANKGNAYRYPFSLRLIS